MGERMEKKNNISKYLRAWYPFDDAAAIGKDASGKGNDASALGENAPKVEMVDGRNAAVFSGGPCGTSYMGLPKDLLEGLGDETGFTVSAWVRTDKILSPWERIFDCGKGMGQPYIFLTRALRGVCFLSEDLAADAGRPGADFAWNHIVLSVTGTKGGTLSSAGPRIYLNGELLGDGWISQTSSGTYRKFRDWLATLDDKDNYVENYIGRSQFPADPDFHGAISDFRIYEKDLAEDEVLALMCESLNEEQILQLAKAKYLPTPKKTVKDDMELVTELMDGQVQVSWRADQGDVIAPDGKVTPKGEPVGVCLTATLSCGEEKAEKSFALTVLPKETVPREITIHGQKEVLDISPTLYGLFYEDINHAADGGIYAEMVQNRSFEDFKFDTYDFRSGENGTSTGRVRSPLNYWFGEIDKATPCMEGGLNELFEQEDPDANPCYVRVMDGAKLYNHGYCDNTFACAMNFREKESYDFSIWAKADADAALKVTLMNPEGEAVSQTVTVSVEGNGKWKKYQTEALVAQKTVLGKMELVFEGEICIDMVSLMPQNVWGATEEAGSSSAHKNFLGNPNYRMRKDLVQTLLDMHPKFLRFPGGCISEGSFIWDNVYDWKDSVGPVEVRKENFNVWGYMMTMGLGYMEYFQLAEDLNAEPLPVMACGVLCQARSDYANPAGGALQEKYISNFVDLIDFAISTDVENNKWAALRKEMGHEEPFGLHYLGVGNENWGTEFYASFETFKHAIDEHMKKYYPGYELHIISTAGAQADDDAYQTGWRFLFGKQQGAQTVRFTDGKESFDKEVTWYPYQKNYLDTIVDEHYYRSNDYLLENVDRYNYYYRPYDENGKMIEDQFSKVFVGEYASSEKNTLAGAVAEAAVMTGFERNSDVVRLAATAPLFNKVGADGTYRWTPDAIWFDDTTVWRTPTYYVQKMFAEYIGEKLLGTTYELYENGEKVAQKPHGGVVIRTVGKTNLLGMKIVENGTGALLFEQDFTKEISKDLQPLKEGKNGYYLRQDEWHDYTVELQVEKIEEDSEIAVGAGLVLEAMGEVDLQKASYFEYCVGKPGRGTGLRVIKDGKEGYTMGDYSSSVFAGNQRLCYEEAVRPGVYKITVDFGGKDTEHLCCYYTNAAGERNGVLECKLESYVRDLFYSVTSDDKAVYAKLVNTDEFEKECLLKLDQIEVENEVEVVTLTGDVKTSRMPNINTKEGELVAPKTAVTRVEEGQIRVMLPANSVNVLVMKKSC